MAVISPNHDWSTQFPNLFRAQPHSWGGMGNPELIIEFTLEVPPEELISNIKVIGRTPAGIVVFESDRGWRGLPGGSREPGETIEETAAREWMEEAGGHITSPLEWVGAFKVDHTATGRYRPHSPFPISYWAFVAADVVLDSEPTSPPDGEQVTSVHQLPVDDAIHFLSVFDTGTTLDIIRLAQRLNRTSPKSP